mmetsp:Transcript_26564/g.55665  ORF Transcript_26564/g.55665 Transcript_26564/m.55665 type:complete len:115 (-) Transcript_26564:19-363(-)
MMAPTWENEIRRGKGACVKNKSAILLSGRETKARHGWRDGLRGESGYGGSGPRWILSTDWSLAIQLHVNRGRQADRERAMRGDTIWWWRCFQGFQCASAEERQKGQGHGKKATM